MSKNVQIIDAFFKLYTVKDFEQITTKDIIDLAECNRSTFYEYFYDKFDLIDTVKIFLLKHVTSNKEIYLNQFIGNLDDDLVAVNLVDKYSDYLLPLLNKDISFVNDYKNSIRSIFTDEVDFSNYGKCPECIEDSIAASISYLTFRYINRTINEEQYIDAVKFLFRDTECNRKYKYIIHFDYEIYPTLTLRNGKHLGYIPR